MTEQLSLLDYQLPPELLIETPTVSQIQPPNPNQYAIAHQKLRLRLYQSIQARFVELAYQASLKGNAAPVMQRMRRTEISRLQELCDECLKKIADLESNDYHS